MSLENMKSKKSEKSEKKASKNKRSSNLHPPKDVKPVKAAKAAKAEKVVEPKIEIPETMKVEKFVATKTDHAYVDVSEIKIDRDFRCDEDPTSQKELMDSLEQYGQLQSIRCRRDGKDVYLVAGSRRLNSIKKLAEEKRAARFTDKDGKIMISVLFEDKKTGSFESYMATYHENAQRRKFSVAENGEIFGRLIDEFKLSQKQVAEACNLNQAAVSQALKFHRDATDELKADSKSGNITDENAKKVAKAAPKKTEGAKEKQSALAAELKKTQGKRVKKETVKKAPLTFSSAIAILEAYQDSNEVAQEQLAGVGACLQLLFEAKENHAKS